MDMKSRAELLMDTCAGILADVGRAYPEDKLEWNRDIIRLHSIIERNEVWFFTILLPSWSKHLTKCLDQGFFQPIDGPHSRPKKGKVYPRLFSGLFLRIFDDSGLLRADADVASIRFLQTLLSFGKKIRMKCDDQIVVKAVQSFIDVEGDVRHPSLNWGDDVLRHDFSLGLTSDGVPGSSQSEPGLFSSFGSVPPGLASHIGAIQSVSDRIFSSFGTPFGILEPHHGPGAISDWGLSGSKYQFPNWPEKLERCFPASEFGFPNKGFWLSPIEDGTTRFNDRRVPSKLIAVPKTQKAPRLIASEPSAHMWMQQALRGFLEDSIKTSDIRFSIDFRSQKVSGQMALESSLTKSHATIDLSDASDRVSCWLIERMVRRNRDLLDAFNAVRTDVIEIKRSKDLRIPKDCPKLLKLKKFSTQGSALTFPVQTIVFTIIAIGTLLSLRGKKVTKGNIVWASKQVRVFGDDIIVPNDSMGSVATVLTTLGLRVNESKSFSKGNFRESCGVDGFKGQDVTPAYVLEPYSLSSPTSVA